MKLVITIDDDIYDDYLKQGATLPKYGTEIDSLYKALWNGVPLPKDHGRLIDADALEYTCNADECGILTGCNHCQYHIVTEHEIDNAPIIIEGSDSE